MNPELKVALLAGRLNVVTCPKCGTSAYIEIPVLFNPMFSSGAMTWVYPSKEESNRSKIEKDLEELRTRTEEASGVKLMPPRLFLGMGNYVKSIRRVGGHLAQFDGSNIRMDSSLNDKPAMSAAWLSYAGAKLLWRKDFSKHFPEKKEYQYTFAEEKDALENLVGVWKKVKEKDSSFADRQLDTLSKIFDAGYIDAYVFNELLVKDLLSEYAIWTAHDPGRLEQYLKWFDEAFGPA
jgi:hypothetical protein